ncbi:hypothetical protein MBM_06460 [Drepanopeziza brunnea f. sp. 'multigermtubi' MB_m1]|uniref:Uncharacterized protein n=1 Tax=Marssonina brunnea f. sp. multigermtubi (strain MB_m1) TaxID=1072389 RepID=K1XRM9_MARBU|nr:uncharacterized protein MBM_06460 [Drepanopeziza brunnea f. sp. 'multigermtubi' MB_m1]EKD15244.1 hypothetical protein MBM_06460 [Drepanopeziza brunnea f. sp. 'multigermtubi' MB_m1]
MSLSRLPLPLLDGHIMLYKGRSAAEIPRDSSLLDSEGMVNMTALASSSQCDFNQVETAWYFSREEETGQVYRSFAAVRVLGAQPWILKIQVPQTFLDSTQRAELWYGRDWKEFVWRSRKGEIPSDPMPAKFDEYAKPGIAKIVEGHVCIKAPTVVSRTKKGDVQFEMEEGHCLVIQTSSGERKATQFVIIDRRVARDLGRLIRGKIHIDVYPPNS